MQSLRDDGVLVPCKAAGLGWETVSAVLNSRFTSGSMAPRELARAKDHFAELTTDDARRLLRFWQVRRTLRISIDTRGGRSHSCRLAPFDSNLTRRERSPSRGVSDAASLRSSTAKANGAKLRACACSRSRTPTACRTTDLAIDLLDLLGDGCGRADDPVVTGAIVDRHLAIGQRRVQP